MKITIEIEDDAFADVKETINSDPQEWLQNQINSLVSQCTTACQVKKLQSIGLTSITDLTDTEFNMIAANRKQ